MNPRVIPFIFSGNEDHPAGTPATSDAIDICGKYCWSIIPEVTGLDGSPLWTIEVANEDSDFKIYHEPETENIAIEDGVDDNHLNFTKMRIVYDPNGNTTGTVKFPLILKK